MKAAARKVNGRSSKGSNVLKFEVLTLAALVLASGCITSAVTQEVNADPVPVYNDHFTKSDFETLSTEFETRNKRCAAGLPSAGICFGRSPLEEEIRVGRTLPEHAPAAPVRASILLSTDLKPANMKTYRYGHVLALIDPETRIVHSRLDLAANSYDAAIERRQAVTPQFEAFSAK